MSTPSALTFDELDQLTGGRLGICDAACPRCGPQCRAATNRKRKTLRIWQRESDFATFYCARCEVTGYAFADNRATLSRDDCARVGSARAEAAAFEREHAAMQLAKARWLWRERKPIAGTAAECYLRAVRGISGALPGTLGFLPARNGHPCALIAAFGLADEPAPGALMIVSANVVGVHITRLKADGAGKDERADEPSKIMIAKSVGFPIVLAPPNDAGGLAIVEGIEDGLTVAETLGLGVWVAGSASRLPALAERVPSCVTCATIFAHNDERDDDKRNAGRDGARVLAVNLGARGIDVAVEGLS
jgi:hypothetical protein